jgi:hypothetical protein
MKRYVLKKEEVETTSKIGEICGFIDTEGRKGYLVYIGNSGNLSAILTEDNDIVPNTSWGVYEQNQFTSVDDFVQNANEQFSRRGVMVRVKDIYFFDTLKEMHKWLSE